LRAFHICVERAQHDTAHHISGKTEVVSIAVNRNGVVDAARLGTAKDARLDCGALHGLADEVAGGVTVEVVDWVNRLTRQQLGDEALLGFLLVSAGSNNRRYFPSSNAGSDVD